MKFIFQYLIAPLTAAAMALLGNYYLVHKPFLQKDYTKIGTDILLNENAPLYLQKYAEDLLAKNSPVNVPESEKQKKLNELFKNVPVDLSPVDNMTYGEAFSQLVVVTKWAYQVSKLCPECINAEILRKESQDVLSQLKGNKRQ